LKKISIAGGAAFTICDAGSGRGATWGDDGTIVFTPSGVPGAALMRVPEAGGTPTNVAKPVGGITERWPQWLPGGKAVMFAAAPIASNFDAADIVVQLLSGGPPKIVQRGGTYGRYVPSGHLLYVHGGTLFAAPFDLDRLEVAGQTSPADKKSMSVPTRRQPASGRSQAVAGDGLSGHALVRSCSTLHSTSG
jgi:serine/threonine-protein kinase